VWLGAHTDASLLLLHKQTPAQRAAPFLPLSYHRSRSSPTLRVLAFLPSLRLSSPCGSVPALMHPSCCCPGKRSSRSARRPSKPSESPTRSTFPPAPAPRPETWPPAYATTAAAAAIPRSRPSSLHVRLNAAGRCRLHFLQAPRPRPARTRAVRAALIQIPRVPVLCQLQLARLPYRSPCLPRGSSPLLPLIAHVCAVPGFPFHSDVFGPRDQRTIGIAARASMPASPYP